MIRAFSLLILIILSTDSFAQRSREYFSEEDLQGLFSHIKDLKRKTGFLLQFEYVSEKDASTFETDVPTLTVYLDFENRKGVIRASVYNKVLSRKYFDRLSYLYLNPGFESNDLRGAIVLMIADIERSYLDQKLLEESVTAPIEEEDGDFSKDFLNVFYFFLFVGLIYAAKSAHKVSQVTNKAEYWQYYGYSRMTFNEKAVVSALVIGFVIVFIFQYVYYYNEIILAYLCLAFVGRPMVLFVSHLYKLVVDKRFIKKKTFNESNHISLGQKLYLLKPDLNTEEFLLLDIYELLIEKYLIITPELKEPAHLNRYRSFISRNQEKNIGKLSPFQQLVINIFPDDKEMYYLIHPLINKIFGELLSFKHYKKDFLILDLVQKELVSPKGWAYNNFTFTTAGNNCQRQMKEKINQLKIEIDEYILGTREIDIIQLNSDLLLITGGEKRIDKLYEKLLNNHKLAEAGESKIGVMFEPSFSFAEYRNAVRNKITDEYESRLGNPSHWTDDY